MRSKVNGHVFFHSPWYFLENWGVGVGSGYGEINFVLFPLCCLHYCFVYKIKRANLYVANLVIKLDFNPSFKVPLKLVPGNDTSTSDEESPGTAIDGVMSDGVGFVSMLMNLPSRVEKMCPSFV